MKWQILILSIFATANSIWAKPSGMDEIKSKFLSAKSKVLSTEIAERKVLSNLYKINQEMKQMSKKRDQLTDRMLIANEDAKDLAKEITYLEKEINVQKKNLSKKLKTIYQIRSGGVLPLIFSAKSSHDLDKILKYLKIYSERDHLLITNYRTNVMALKKTKTRLSQKVVRLVRLKQSLDHQEKDLEKQQNLKSELLSSLNKSKTKEIKNLARYRKQSTKYIKSGKVESISELLDESLFAVKGQLVPPVDGVLVQDYGIIQHPKYKYRLSHKGYFYSAPYSNKVEAVYGGRVSFCGNIDGYGNTIIVDHGDHYYTLYANMSETYVKQGDKIDKREELGKVGPSPMSTTYGVYFEIRHFSDAIDPKPWLMASNRESN